jgi:hypothetical protein
MEQHLTLSPSLSATDQASYTCNLLLVASIYFVLYYEKKSIFRPIYFLTCQCKVKGSFWSQEHLLDGDERVSKRSLCLALDLHYLCNVDAWTSTRDLLVCCYLSTRFTGTCNYRKPIAFDPRHETAGSGTHNNVFVSHVVFCALEAGLTKTDCDVGELRS